MFMTIYFFKQIFLPNNISFLTFWGFEWFVSILKKNFRKNLFKVFYLLDSEYNWKKIIQKH